MKTDYVLLSPSVPLSLYQTHHTDYYSVPVRQMTPNSQSTNCYIIYTLSSYVVTPYVLLLPTAYHHMYVLLTVVDSLLN